MYFFVTNPRISARLCCRQHNNFAYVAKSDMWRSAFLASSQQQTSEPNAT